MPLLQLDVCSVHHSNFDNAANAFWGSKGSDALSCWTNFDHASNVILYTVFVKRNAPLIQNWGFVIPQGGGSLTVDMVDYLYGGFKETQCFGFLHLQPFWSYLR